LRNGKWEKTLETKEVITNILSLRQFLYGDQSALSVFAILLPSVPLYHVIPVLFVRTLTLSTPLDMWHRLRLYAQIEYGQGTRSVALRLFVLHGGAVTKQERGLSTQEALSFHRSLSFYGLTARSGTDLPGSLGCSRLPAPAVPGPTQSPRSRFSLAGC